MKRLILLRHAQAVAKTKTDRDRELSPTGRAQTERVATLLPRDGFRPAAALVSPSARTRETWDRARTGLGDVPVRIEEPIYSGDAGDLVALVRQQPDAADPLILVGHNPTIHELAAALLDGAAPGASPAPDDFPTGAVAVLDLDVAHWSELRGGRATLVSFTAPDAIA